jgi:hypothetical protein
MIWQVEAAGEECHASSGGLAGGLDGPSAASGADEVKGEPSDQGHVASAVAAAQAGEILIAAPSRSAHALT